MTREAALISALGEAVERYSSTCIDPDEIVHARRAELVEESLDPSELVLYRPEQYGRHAYRPYTEATALGWMRARSLVSSRELLLPALAVSLAYQVRSSEEYLFGPSSNGLAAGSCLLDAVLAGLLEVIERDAFLITWCNRSACTAVDPETHPEASIRGLADAYRRRGVALHLFALPVDHPVHVFMALALESAGGEGPAAVVGLGADLDPARAAAKAALEVGQVRPALRMRLRDPEARGRLAELEADPREVSSLEDHDLLYASPAMVDAFEFLLSSPEGRIDWDADAAGEPVPAKASDRLERIVGHFREVDQDVLYSDLTPPELRRLGLYTVRVVVPGFQPIDFGWHEIRLGGSRLFELPHSLGLTSAPSTVDDLNQLPHPLA